MTIDFYWVKAENTRRAPTPEQTLAQRMGHPPWGLQTVSPTQSTARFAAGLKGPFVGLIFDLEFYYSRTCWLNWVEAAAHRKDPDRIFVPLGNQNPAWRQELEVPLYLTLRGVEIASDFVGPQRWVKRRSAVPEEYCVAIVPATILKQIPAPINLGVLPRYWAEKKQELLIFCKGWLHSFNVLADAGKRQDLLAMCRWKGRVLEIGCGTGLMAQHCRELGYDVSWTGVDLNRQSLLKARQSMDLAIQTDVNHGLPIRTDRKFDRVVCADVLEHLAYPWGFLTRLKTWIKPDGLLVASVPNVGHWSIVEDLLCGRWDETPAGILCVSHLRFGTQNSWSRWFRDSGWDILRWEMEKIPLPKTWNRASECFGENFNPESLETVRYRLLAQMAPDR